MMNNDALKSKVEEYVRVALQNREHFVAQYLRATGANIEDLEMVEQTSQDRLTTTFYVQPRQVKHIKIETTFADHIHPTTPPKEEPFNHARDILSRLAERSDEVQNYDVTSFYAGSEEYKICLQSRVYINTPEGKAEKAKDDERKAKNERVRSVIEKVRNEVHSASAAWPPFNSAHEGYAVLLEEVEELWAHVKTNQKKRDIEAMKKEAIQVAAMAIRFAVNVCDEGRGRA